MMVSGFVYVHIAIQQPLTDFIWLACPHDQHRVKLVARVFHAMEITLKSIKAHYEQIRPSPERRESAYLPIHTTFGPRDGATTIKYTGRVSDNQRDLHRAIFYAVTISDPVHSGTGRLLIVKFVKRYDSEAHILLAREKLAPELHWCEAVPGRLMMVVMDQVNGYSVHDAGLSGQLPTSARDDVRRALDLLHGCHRVFGDLRPPNIMLTGPHIQLKAFGQPPAERDDAKVHAMLIDFDWCGKENEQCYPVTINMAGDIPWDKEVQPGGKLTRSHDNHMFECL